MEYIWSLIYLFRENIEDEENDNVEDSQISQEPSSAHGKKRGRPIKKGDKEWQDEEVDILIECWRKHDCLFNSKHKLYMNKNARAKAIERIIEALKKENIEVTNKQVQDKLTKLRNYYGAERRKEESSKVSGSSTDSLYTSSWRFYTNLHFLKDNLTPRPTTNNIETSIEEETEDGVYQISNPPSAKSARKLKDKSRENAEVVMAKASKALECITARYQNAPPPPAQSIKTKGEDGLFSEMVFEMLSSIPDSMQKAMLKIEIQQKIMQLKYSSSAPNQPNFFPMPQFQGLPNTFTQQGSLSSSGGGMQPFQASPSTHSNPSPLASPIFQPF